MSFKVGDKVVYPNHGVGVIEGLRPSAPAHSIFEAATKGDLDTVRSLLDEDPGSIDATNEKIVDDR